MSRPSEPGVTRRTLLRAAAGGAAVAAAGSLPAWARPVAAAAATAGLRRPDSLPFPHLPAGTPSMPQIDHVVVLIMENHSFDNLLGMVPHTVRGRGSVDGLTVRRGRVMNYNRDAAGTRVFAQRSSSPCQLPSVPSQAWNASHISYDGGRNDGFVRASGPEAMRFWDGRDLPFTYSLARYFPLGERFFCSTLAQTFPNRRFFFAGTASGTINDHAVAITTPAANGTIWDRLDAHHVDLGHLRPGGAELRDHPRLGDAGPGLAPADVRPLPARRRRGQAARSSRSSTRTTARPRRRTRRTCRSASASWPRS